MSQTQSIQRRPGSATIRRFLTACIAIALFGGCASKAGKPIVDMQGVNPQQYEQDLNECSGYADEVAVGEKAVTGAVTGAVVGGALGAIWDGYRGGSPERGAASGAVVGGAGGIGSGVSERNQVVKSCLRGRGYSVLN